MPEPKNYEDAIVESYRANCTFGYGGGRRMSYTEIDKMMYQAFTAMREMQQAEKLETDESDLPSKIVPPNSVMYVNCAELSAYLVAVYVAKSTIIEVPDLPNAMHVTAALKDKIGRDSGRHAWALELIKIIQNSVIYNFGAAELRLTAKRENVLRAINPYNFFYDQSVPPDKIGSDALYAGYTELVTLPTLYRLISASGGQWLTDVGKSLISDINALERVSYLTSQRSEFIGDYCAGGFGMTLSNALVRSARKSNDHTPDWHAVVNDLSDVEQRVKLRTSIAKGNYQLTTYYCRAMPEWLGLPAKKYASYNGSDSGQIPVWKMYILDHTYLMAVEPVVESHGYLPLMAGQVQVDTAGDSLTYSESLAPVQVFSAKLNIARIAAMRRALSDRGLYDKSLIESDDINNRSPTAQIPVNGHSMRDLGKGIRDAYFHLPFDSSGIAQLMGGIGEVDDFASRISGNNPQMQGAHLPGNRTAGEAQRVNTMGEGRFRVYSILFQQTFMLPFKIQLRSNLSDSTQELTYYDPATGRKQSVSQAEYAEYEPDFVLADGMMPSTKMISPDMLSSLLTAVIQIPQLQATKDVGAMVDLLARAGGVEDFHKIPPPNPEVLKAQQAAQQAQTSAQQGQQQPAATK